MTGYWQALLDQGGAMMNADLRRERANIKEEMRRRLDLIAADYGVPASEVAKVRGRLKHDECCAWRKIPDQPRLADLRRRTIVARRTSSADADHIESVTDSGSRRMPGAAALTRN